ncbi:MAG: putative bifunctional diguanylate cyclase/phosphodiesterase [Pontibacterium sp.]
MNIYTGGVALNCYSQLTQANRDMNETAIDLDRVYTVLVCDDDDVDREKIARLLAKISLKTRVEFAESAERMLEVLNGAPLEYDCIILDYRLGTTDGLNLMKGYSGGAATLPVVMVTGYSDERVAVEAIRMGAYDYLSKSSLTPELLGVTIEGVIRRTLLQQLLTKAEEQLLKQSMLDEVTGLANRNLFFDRLEHLVSLAEHDTDPFALLLIDLDKFKQINDTFGHANGDQVLGQMASCLSAVARQSDTVARIGGDEFAILLAKTNHPNEAVAYAQKLIEEAAKPILVDDQIVHVGVSIGIAFYPYHATDSKSLYIHADQALYESKKHMRSYTVYEAKDPTMPLAVSEALPKAFENKEFFIELQPKVFLQTGKVTSAEALIRWQHPTLGRVMPGQFLSDVERTGMVHDLTLVSLRLAAKAICLLQDRGINVTVAVNISARVLDDEKLPSKLMSVLDEYNLASTNFILEVTETALASSRDASTNVLNQLTELGFKLSIDDFGAGFTSFQNIRDTKISEIKIDRMFITDIITNEKDESIVRSISVLAESLGIPVVAEGIECQDAMAHVEKLGCTHAQGYFIARPMGVEAFADWIKSYNAK